MSALQAAVLGQRGGRGGKVMGSTDLLAGQSQTWEKKRRVPEQIALSGWKFSK